MAVAAGSGQKRGRHPRQPKMQQPLALADRIQLLLSPPKCWVAKGQTEGKGGRFLSVKKSFHPSTLNENFIETVGNALFLWCHKTLPVLVRICICAFWNPLRMCDFRIVPRLFCI
eukprot:EG_transcript_44075